MNLQRRLQLYTGRKVNTHAIVNASGPCNAKEVRSFLGKVNYYHRFIPERTQLLDPLHQLTQKNQPFVWTEEAQKAFDCVKEILTKQPTLRIFDPELPIILYTDASRIGVGAVLKQRRPNGEELPVGYFSRKLLPYQVNYSVTEIELLAILEAIDAWHFYLCGRHFSIVTDHLPLKGLDKNKKPNTRLYNWAMRLNQYDFTISYRPGAMNEEADYLSRHPVQDLIELTKEAPAVHRWEGVEKVEPPLVDGVELREYSRIPTSRLYDYGWVDNQTRFTRNTMVCARKVSRRGIETNTRGVFVKRIRYH